MLPAFAKRSFLVLSLFFAGAARANGAFPEVSQLVADPGDPAHLVLRSNFGLLTTRDTGQNWDLVCEGGIGYQNIEPPVAVLSDGSTIAALASGIARGDPSACNFSVAAGVTEYVADVSRVPSAPDHAVAIAVDIAANISRIWQSTDDGATWTPLGVPIANLNALTLDVAASDANVLYVSGTTQTDTLQGVLARSADAGQTWTVYNVPFASKVSAPYIAAVSASDAQTVYVRMSGTPGYLLSSHDGGADFALALQFLGPVEGFAVSPDEQFVLASGSVDGVWRAPTSTLAFERLSCAKLSCLSWTDSGLFACADEFEAGFLVGQSTDQGVSFQPRLHLSCVRGPLDCAATSSVGAVCPPAWPAISEQLGDDCASAGSFTPSTTCRDAGSSASDAAPSDASRTFGTVTGQPQNAVTPVVNPALSLHGGCGCRVASRSPRPNAWLALASLGVCWSRRSVRKSRRSFSRRASRC
ncbi:MAG TPA: hypothetical protein VK745_07935 [Polyangiaceae bacterium]|nr:hypothetical protein [Polyangiaceae bacterium]